MYGTNNLAALLSKDLVSQYKNKEVIRFNKTATKLKNRLFK